MLTMIEMDGENHTLKSMTSLMDHEIIKKTWYKKYNTTKTHFFKFWSMQ